MSIESRTSRPLQRFGLTTFALVVALASVGLLTDGARNFASAVCDTTQVLLPPPVQVSTGGYPIVPVVGDFNGDGLKDVAVACLTGGVISVSLGQVPATLGTVAFGPVQSFSAGGSPVNIVTGDFNHDGVLDLAAAEVENRVAIMLGGVVSGHGDGTFGAPLTYTLGAIARGVTTRDFNHDGILDLAVATEAGVKILMGHATGGFGDGTFLSPVTYGHACWGVTAADFNADGITDLAFTDGASNVVGVLFGQGSGGFGNGLFTVGPFMDTGGIGQGREIAVGDLNGDGALDFVTNSRDQGMRIFTNTKSGGIPTGVFTVAPFANTRSINSVALADFDNNGKLDILASSPGDDSLLIYFNGTAGFVGGPYNIPTGDGPIQVVANDVNGDGVLDVLVACSAVNRFYAYAGRCVAPGSPPPPPPPPYDRRPHIAYVKDVHGDQGGHVFLAWTKSPADSDGANVITGYRVWRRLPLTTNLTEASTAALRSGAERRQLASVPGFWEALATLPAEKLDGYAYTAPSPQDSIDGSNPYIAFFVTALTANAAVFYESPVDSGYSVDNLAPAILQLAVAVPGNGFVALHWAPGHEADLAGYRIYHGGSPSFVPGPSNLLAAQRDTGYTDLSVGGPYYKLAAVDIHGNVGRYVLLSPDAPTATLAAFTAAELTSDRVTLHWFTPSGAGIPAVVSRRSGTGGWSDLGSIVSDGLGNLVFEDQDVVPGGSYLYHLGIEDAGEVQIVGETLIRVPTPAFALLGARPNPVVDGRLSVAFSLGTSHASQLELLDIGGRVLRHVDVGALGVGSHSVDLSPGSRIAPGMYFVRLTQDNRHLIQRVAVLR